MDEIRALYTELNQLPLPKGLAEVSKDIDIDVFEYDSYIMGLASSYLNGDELFPDDIRVEKSLSNKLDQSIGTLIKLRDYKNKLDELGNALFDTLKAKS